MRLFRNLLQLIIDYDSHYRSILFCEFFREYFHGTAGVKRDSNNRRIFDERDVKWIKDLTCLKRCGMSILEMKEYLDLCLQGEATIPQRKEMLAQKQEALRLSLSQLEESIAYIDWKQNFYDEVLSGRRPYVSNLIQTEEPDK